MDRLVFRRVASAVGALAWVGAASATFAATISYSDTESTTDTGTADLSLSAFDPSQGTLTGVSITYSTDGTVVLTGVNTGGAFTAVESGALKDTFTFPALGAYDATLVSATVYTTNTTFPTFSPVLTTFATTPLSTGVPVDPSDFLSFEGSGNLAFSAASSGSNVTFTPNPGSSAFSNIGGNKVSATITYTYLPTPEPATAGIVGIAGAFALLRRRRSPQSAASLE